MIDMREQMVETLKDLLADDERLVLVLAEISYRYFRNAPREYAERILNLGIMEQTMVSVGAGLALEGFIPVMHSIVPFLIERPFEQIKDDFCYQQLSGKFVSNGASYDYSTEGMTHHGPGDVPILRSLPNMQIVVPGTAQEFDALFRESYANGASTYYRLSASNNSIDHPVRFGKLEIVKRGTAATVIAVGPTLSPVLSAVEDLDVTVLYCTTVAPFDAETLRATCSSVNIVLIEPYYEGALTADICEAMKHTPIRIESIGIPHKVLTHYGTPEEHDKAIGLTPQGIRHRIEHFLSI